MFSPIFPPGLIPETTRSGFSFSSVCSATNHGVGGRAFDRVFALGDLVAINRLAQRERLRGGAALVRRRHNGDRADFLHRGDERAQARRVNSVVICDQNIRHENRLRKNSRKLSRIRREEKWSGRLDLNQRPHAPQACALPGCATSRLPLAHQSAYHSRSRRVKTARSSSCRSSRNFRCAREAGSRTRRDAACGRFSARQSRRCLFLRRSKNAAARGLVPSTDPRDVFARPQS